MSFSAEVKEELARKNDDARHCNVAEITAIVCLGGRLSENEQHEPVMTFQTENAAVARKYFTLLKKTYRINADVKILQHGSTGRNRICILTVEGRENIDKLLSNCILEDGTDTGTADGLVLRRECCRRAFIRGAFISSGSVSDPNKAYHFEIVCASPAKAAQIERVIGTFDIRARTVQRKKSYVVYVKDGSQVVDLFNIMGAHEALMNMENIRIMKEMRNNVNRSVNCEMANINKTVSAASQQLEDINFIIERGEFGSMSESLQELAQLRLENPEATLSELGDMLPKHVSKSGVNRRFGKISMLADELRNRQ
ncbi:MAG: DNA-binding protein WhiA [Lachnospiraceae bacterium]|jgi:DNA-binding protein WhiA